MIDFHPLWNNFPFLVGRIVVPKQQKNLLVRQCNCWRVKYIVVNWCYIFFFSFFFLFFFWWGGVTSFSISNFTYFEYPMLSATHCLLRFYTWHSIERGRDRVHYRKRERKRDSASFKKLQSTHIHGVQAVINHRLCFRLNCFCIGRGCWAEKKHCEYSN